jgi:ATP-dependent Lon protease
VVILNEVDKIGGGSASSSGTQTSMADALLPLLEQGTAQRFRCPASGLDHDLSRVNWILTANRIECINSILRSRLEAIHVPSLSYCDFELYIDLIIPAQDRDAVKSILAGLAPSTPLTLRHITRLTDRLYGSDLDQYLH